MKSLILVGTVLQTLFMLPVTHADLFDKDVDVSAYADAEQLKKEAAKYNSAKWKIPLDQRIIENMSVLDDNLAILSMRNYNEELKRDQIAAIDLKIGKALWFHSATEDAEDVSVAGTSKKYTLIKTDFETKTNLVSLKTLSGEKVWEKILPKSGDYLVQQLDDEHVMLAIAHGNDVEYRYMAISTGLQLWSHTVKKTGESIAKVITYNKGIIIPADKLVSVNKKNGHLLWKHNAININASAPQSVIGNQGLYIIDNNNALNKISLLNGKLIWSHKNPKQYIITAVDVGKARVYMRGIENAGAGQNSVFIMIDNNAGRLRWRTSIKDKLPLVSNLIENKDNVYVSSPTTLYAIKIKTGDIKFLKLASSGQLSVYPVILRQIENKIVFIGELVVSAYDAITGKKYYRRGLTGISPAADLSAMESSIKRLTKKIERARGGPESSNSTIFMQASKSAQASTRAHYQNHLNYKLAGDSRSDSEYMAYKIDRSFEKMYAGLSVYEATLNLSNAIYEGLVSKMDEENMLRHKLIRNTIITAYPAMMSENYAYRPTRTLNLFDTDAPEFMQITTVNLNNGKKNKTTMSVPYRDYGLWIYIDEKKKIAFQQSIGLSPDENKPVMSYLIAKAMK